MQRIRIESAVGPVYALHWISAPKRWRLRLGPSAGLAGASIPTGGLDATRKVSRLGFPRWSVVDAMLTKPNAAIPNVGTTYKPRHDSICSAGLDRRRALRVADG